MLPLKQSMRQNKVLYLEVEVQCIVNEESKITGFRYKWEKTSEPRLQRMMLDRMQHRYSLMKTVVLRKLYTLLAA